MAFRRISPRRRRINALVTEYLDGAQALLVRHWLGITNSALALVLGLAVLAPILMAFGFPQMARPIYWMYQAVCHQWPFRSFFLFGPQPVYQQSEIVALASASELWSLIGSPELGFKMAFCERDFAITAGGLLMGLLYIRVRRRLAPPSVLFYIALLIPIFVDGITQLPGWRESIWEYRVSTGAITGVATVWLLFPYLELRADRWLAATQPPADNPTSPLDLDP